MGDILAMGIWKTSGNNKYRMYQTAKSGMMTVVVERSRLTKDGKEYGKEHYEITRGGDIGAVGNGKPVMYPEYGFTIDETNEAECKAERIAGEVFDIMRCDKKESDERKKTTTILFNHLYWLARGKELPEQTIE